MRTRLEKLESLLELPVILGSQADVQEILRLISVRAAALFEAEVASLVMINPRTRETVKTVIKEGRDANERHYRLAQTNIIGWSLHHRQPFLSPDLQTDSRFSTGLFRKSPVKSAMCVPLQIEAEDLGYIVMMNKRDEGEFAQDDLTLLERMAAIVAPYLSNAQKLQELFNTPLPDAALLARFAALGLVGQSQPFIEMLRAVDAASRCDVRVALQGQSGTGKELVANAIHQLSARKHMPFIAIDCGAIPENLVESELFGHVKGAFTGANQDRKGLLEEAHGGTLFMDEVGNLPVDIQAKFMRVLQQGEIRPLGSNHTRKIDVRIITAASTPMQQLVEEKRFREDLYYRLYVYPIMIPSLNERSEDIPFLATRMLQKFSAQQRKSIAAFDRELMDFLRARHWTGNIRELENLVERLVTLASSETTTLSRDILPADLVEAMRRGDPARAAAQTVKSLEESVAEHEELLIRQALIKNDWNQSQAARDLKLQVQTLRYKMKKLGIEKPG